MTSTAKHGARSSPPSRHLHSQREESGTCRKEKRKKGRRRQKQKKPGHPTEGRSRPPTATPTSEPPNEGSGLDCRAQSVGRSVDKMTQATHQTGNPSCAGTYKKVHEEKKKVTWAKTTTTENDEETSARTAHTHTSAHAPLLR